MKITIEVQYNILNLITQIWFYLDQCSSITLGVGESVYYETECSSTPPIDGGVGCGAGGIPNCRYCGFSNFKPCPTTTTSKLII